MKKFNKEVIAHYEKYIDNESFEVYVLDGGYSNLDNESFYNIHVISERYRSDEFNTLKLQEPHSAMKNPYEYFDEARLISYLMEHFIWDRFYGELQENDIQIYTEVSRG